MEKWNEFRRTLSEAREPTPFKSAAQKRYKKLRKKNDIYSSPAGHKNLNSGAPFNNKTQPAGTDRLRFEEEVDPQSIDTDSLQVRTDLERRVWDEQDNLKAPLREQMLKVAIDFIENLELPVKVVDIKLTGSLANYNWSKFSDVDLHIIVDFNDYDAPEELIRGYFDGKRIAWNNAHDIKLLGYDIELYVEAEGDVHISTGMYSVMRSEWITIPRHENTEFDDDLVKQKAAGLMDLIDGADEILSRKDYRAAYALAEKLKAKIRNMRKCGLEQSGAYSVENLAFKVLRRNGYLQSLTEIRNRAYDGLNSYTSGGGIVVRV
jgi:predicted nucleotidyltransferase